MTAVIIPAWPPASHPMWVRVAQIVNALRAKGAQNPLIIAAITNGYAESTDKPLVVGDHGQSFGPWQDKWVPRGQRIFDKTGIDVRTETSLARLVDAMWWELENVFPKTLAKLRAATTAA